MKKYVLIVLLVFYTACVQNASVHTNFTPRQIAELIYASQDEIAYLVLLLPEDDFFAEYIVNIYGFNADYVETGVILFSYGMFADEIAVFRLAEDADIGAVETVLSGYIQRRASVFMGYAPDQAAILRNSLVSSRGNHIALLVSRDPRSAESTFLTVFGDDPPALPAAADISFILYSDFIAGDDVDEPYDEVPDEPDDDLLTVDAFDHDLILTAWRSENIYNLSPINRSILEKSISVIDMLITEDMTQHEKQLAVHDWIIDWASFDTEIHNRAPTANPHPHNDNPYGVLIGQRGMCLGFTLAFQLFMDMLDIESIVVEGTNYFGDYHSWNQVRIGDNWYAVDVTWNNPVGGARTPEVTHRYFNVSSQFLWDAGHRWDRDSVPEAAG